MKPAKDIMTIAPRGQGLTEGSSPPAS